MGRGLTTGVVVGHGRVPSLRVLGLVCPRLDRGDTHKLVIHMLELGLRVQTQGDRCRNKGRCLLYTLLRRVHVHGVQILGKLGAIHLGYRSFDRETHHR